MPHRVSQNAVMELAGGSYSALAGRNLRPMGVGTPRPEAVVHDECHARAQINEGAGVLLSAGLPGSHAARVGYEHGTIYGMIPLAQEAN